MKTEALSLPIPPMRSGARQAGIHKVTLIEVLPRSNPVLIYREG
jgi:hypothetical protein